MSTTILFSYPLLALFRRIRRVDSRYAYLVTRDGFVPLKRREGCLSAIWRYVVCGDWYESYEPNLYFEKKVLDTYEHVSAFFEQLMLKEEYDEPIEETFGELGKLWDEKYDEMYGVSKILEEMHTIEIELKKELTQWKQCRKQHEQGFFYYDTFDHGLYPMDEKEDRCPV